jgi:hypothetical protein
VGCTDDIRSANPHSRPPNNIDSPIVNTIWVRAGTQSEILTSTEISLPNDEDVLVLLPRRILPFVLVTVNYTSTGTFTLTSSTSRNCTSTTCTTKHSYFQ